MLRFPSIIKTSPHSSFIISSPFLLQQFRFSSSSSVEDIPSTSEIISAFKTFGIHGTSLHDLSRKGNGTIDEASIKKKFLELAKQQHPDVAKKNDSSSTSTTTKVNNMSEINGAYKVLKNFFKAGGFPKFAPSSSSNSSSSASSGAYYKNPYQHHGGNNSNNADAEYFWAGFEDVMRNHPNFSQGAHPNTFYTNSSASGKSSSSKYQRHSSSSAETIFGDEEEFLKYQAEAAAAAEFFAQHGQEFSPGEAFEMWRRYQQEENGRSYSFRPDMGDFYDVDGNAFYQQFSGGPSTRYDDARTMREAGEFFDGFGGGEFGHHHPFEFVGGDFEDLPPHMFYHYVHQQQNGGRGGGKRRGKKNTKSMKNNNNKKPWMNPDEFFEESFSNPHQRQQHQNHQKNSNNNNNKNHQQQRNSAGMNLSDEEYEAILTMHGEGRSFTFISNALGLNEKQAIAGFNVAKRKLKKEQEQQDYEEQEEKKNNSTATMKETAEEKSRTKKKEEGTTSSEHQIKDDSREHSRPNKSQHHHRAVKGSESEGIFDVDEDDDEYYDMENDPDYPRPFKGQPMHFHHNNNNSRKHGNHNNNNNNNNNRHNNNNKNRRHGGNNNNGKWRNKNHNNGNKKMRRNAF